MHAQLEAIAAEFGEAQERLHRLAARLPDDQWRRRPAPGRWSVGECVAHLNLTATAMLPRLDLAIQEARSAGGGAGAVPRRYRRGLLGGLIWRMSGPSARVRTRTAAAFVPSGDEAPRVLMDTFDRLQLEQLSRVRAADGLPLQEVRIVSPFDSRVRYNLFAALGILARHERRHVWQAEQVERELAEPGMGATRGSSRR